MLIHKLLDRLPVTWSASHLPCAASVYRISNTVGSCESRSRPTQEVAMKHKFAIGDAPLNCSCRTKSHHHSSYISFRLIPHSSALRCSIDNCMRKEAKLTKLERWVLYQEHATCDLSEVSIPHVELEFANCIERIRPMPTPGNRRLNSLTQSPTECRALLATL